MRSRMLVRSRLAVGVVSAALGAACLVGSPGVAQAHPASAGLRPALASAFDAASTAATKDGVPLWITSGSRSEQQQRQLWREAIATHGSPEAARRWVLPAEESPHVTGEAVDVGPFAGAAWLERNGHRWGLCRTFDNEWWHFELATVPGSPCPPRFPGAAARQDSPAR